MTQKERDQLKVQVRNIFKEAREKSGLDQTQFAKSLGMSQGSISKIERGAMWPSIESYVALKREYKVGELK